MPNVFLRKDGRYAVKIKEGSTWKQKTFKTKEEALAFLGQAEPLTEKVTVAQAVLLYVKDKPWLSDSRKNIYNKVISKGGYAEEIADKLVEDLNRRDLENIRNKCRSNGLKAQTINLYVDLLKASFNWIAEQDLIADNPWRKYRPLKVTDKRSFFASLEDFSKVYNLLPPYMQWLCRTCLALCLRPQKEFLSLKWEDFDFAKGCVKVYMPKVKAYKIVYPPTEYLEEAKERMASATSPYVILGEKGGRVRGNTFKVAWQLRCKKAGVIAPMYCMRHLAASLTLEGGGNLSAVASQLGHSTPKTTEQFYLHSSEKGQREAGQALAVSYGKLFGTNGNKKEDKN